MKKASLVFLMAGFVAACGGNASHPPFAPTGLMSVTGTWAGSASDSSSAMGAGALMGQAGMGTMTWPLTQSGATVTGSVGFAGMQGRMPGMFSGTMSGDDLTFTMDMPANSMMSSGCVAHATGTAHVDRTSMTMTGSYSGTNTCTGPFVNGHMTMARR